MGVVTIEKDKLISEKILNIVSKYVDLEEEQDFNLIESIVFVKMIIELETIFNFRFDDHMLSSYKFPTIDSFVEYIRKKCNQNI